METVWDEDWSINLNDLNPRPTRDQLEEVLTSEQDGRISNFKLSVGGDFRRIRHRWGVIKY